MKTAIRKEQMSIADTTLLRELCERRIGGLTDAINKCAVSLYPNIYATRIADIRDFFERQTGYSIDD